MENEGEGKTPQTFKFFHKMRNKGHNLGYIHIWKGENYLFNLKNREEKEKYFSTKSWKSKGERAVQYKNLVQLEEEENCFLKILTIERKIHISSSKVIVLFVKDIDRRQWQTYNALSVLVWSEVDGPAAFHIIFSNDSHFHLFTLINPQSSFSQFETDSTQVTTFSTWWRWIKILWITSVKVG